MIKHLLFTKTGFSRDSSLTSLNPKEKDKYLRNNHKVGNYMMWNDTFRHRGILNNTNNLSIALIIRFSNVFDRETFLPLKKNLFCKSETEDNFKYDEIVSKAKSITARLLSIARYDYKSFDKDNLLTELNYKTTLEKNEYKIMMHIIDYGLKTFTKRVSNNPNVNWFGN